MTTEEDRTINMRPRDMRPSEEVNQENQEVSSRKDVLEALLEKVKDSNDWVNVTTPSHCEVKVRPITYQDETQFQLQLSQDSTVAVNNLLEACTEADWSKLYVFDKNYLMFKLREISYGNHYNIEGTCTKCFKRTELNLELNQLPVKYYDGDGTITINLPDSGVKTVLKIPSSADQRFMEDLEGASRALWRFVVSLDGETDTDIIQEFIKRTTLKDVTEIRTEVYGLDYGMETECWFHCAHCDEKNKTSVGINETFFTQS